MSSVELVAALRLLNLIGANATSAAEYTDPEIKGAFKQEALLHHPDKGGSADRFVALGKARDYLLDRNAKLLEGKPVDGLDNLQDEPEVSRPVFEPRTFPGKINLKEYIRNGGDPRLISSLFLPRICFGERSILLLRTLAGK